MQFKHNKQLVPRAKELRKNMTKEERHLWYDFLRDHPSRFVRQKVLGYYIADFYSATAKLIIELDGSQHYEESNQIQDAQRTEFLQQFGLRVLRIPNNAIWENFRGVCEYIDEATKKPPLGAQGARKGALPVADAATAAVHEVPEGIRITDDRQLTTDQSSPSQGSLFLQHRRRFHMGAAGEHVVGAHLFQCIAPLS